MKFTQNCISVAQFEGKVFLWLIIAQIWLVLNILSPISIDVVGVAPLKSSQPGYSESLAWEKGFYLQVSLFSGINLA